MKDFGLIVIGAHFGVWLKDEITKYKNKNILLVEPVPYNYKILKEEYKNFENIIICTNAIIDKNETKNFFFVKEKSIHSLGKHWASGIGSFDKQHILNHRTKRFKVSDEDIEIKEIEFITFDTLIKNYGVKSIEKLQIDVEGAEYKILNSIDLSNIDIKEIFFEFKHFDGTFKEGPKLLEIKDKLISSGYEINNFDDENIIAKKII
ncbi:FkbM family methyltransferase [Pelagibacterales bacterium SAG-MED07]|nr:FkbM family methyltransferase [Pelagibacterales bacterium SAG-MED07]